MKVGMRQTRDWTQSDNRGSFEKIWEFDYVNDFVDNPIQQVNISNTNKAGTFKGMHYQYPKPDAKIVRVLRGVIVEFAVDIVKDSPTFGVVTSIINNGFSVFIPKGYAHGYQTLVDNCQVLYLHDEPYLEENKKTIPWYDPFLKIEGLPIMLTEISDNDDYAPYVTKRFKGIKL
jgi:dTDP-4-dehydrorhamnose 3,5-epimerase